MNVTRKAGRRGAFVGAIFLGTAIGSLGCSSMVGRWTGEELQPVMARDQFKFLRPAEQRGKLVSADLRLQQDGSYTADLNYDGQMEQSLGNWKIDSHNYLTFVDKEGKSYGYAVRRQDEQNLKLVKSIKGTDATLKLKKQP